MKHAEERSGRWHPRSLTAPMASVVVCFPGVEYGLRVRFFAIALIVLLLPLRLSMPEVKACSTSACCGPNCSESASANQVSCCKAPLPPDRAINPARDTRHFDSIATMPAVAVTIAIAHLQNTLVARGYSPPDRLASLALLCSRQI
jgi:hypothetical protein